MVYLKGINEVILLITVLFITQPVCASEYESNCGGYTYGVQIKSGPWTYQKEFALYYKQKDKEPIFFHKTDTMVYLTAACIKDSNGKFLFLFQEFGYGGDTPDDFFGLYDPSIQKILLTPHDKANEVAKGNGNELKRIIGYSLPFMIDDIRTFCCDYKQSPIVKLPLKVVKAMITEEVNKRCEDPFNKQELCKAADTYPISSKEYPNNAAISLLEGCDSVSLYYGLKDDIDYVKAKQCALIQRDHNVLSMSYANGKGGERNYYLAIRFACSIKEGTLIEKQERLQRLCALKKADNPQSDFNICDDIKSGYMATWCASLANSHQIKLETQVLELFDSKLTGKESDAFRELKNASALYFKSRLSNEIDLGDKGGKSFILLEEMSLNSRLMAQLRKTEHCEITPYTLDDYKKADAELNSVYKKIYKMHFIPYTPLQREGIIHTERAWMKYRDAWVYFGQLKCPNISPENWQTIFTKERVMELEHIAS